jgi:hypothetical protein
MMKLTYKGTDERVFPTLGITVKPGDEFDAPEGFTHPDCESAGHKSVHAKPTEEVKTLSAASDLTDKEVK